MDEKAINLLNWQRARGLRFPFYRPRVVKVDPISSMDVLSPERLLRFVSPLSLQNIEELPHEPLVLFFSGIKGDIVDESYPWEDLLSKITMAMNLQEGKVFHLLAPQNRKGDLGGGILRILEQVRPKVLVLLGDASLSFFPKLGSGDKPSIIRGALQHLPDFETQLVISTWHPEQLITEPLLKRDVWAQMQIVMHEIS